MKKSIIITLCLIISMLSTSVVFAMDNETIKAETEDEEIINVDMNSLDLSKSKKIECIVAQLSRQKSKIFIMN